MIVHLKESVDQETATDLAKESDSIVLKNGQQTILITPSKLKELPLNLEEFAEDFFVTDSDIQLASKSYRSDIREIALDDVKFGGNTNNTVVIAGPCSVESVEQIDQCAENLTKLNLKILRGGCFKPRTSPYSFQGMGLEGLKILAKAREEYGLKIATEVRDHSHVEQVIEYADIIQIGAKSMYDHGILKACAKTTKPILLKRGFGSTIQEFVQCAEFILSGGNPNVILCERGIRTFENKSRFTLDLCGVAYLKEHINLPIILDPSHAMGVSYGVPDLARACMAMNIDGLLIEMHPNPKVAKSDAAQQLDIDQFNDLFESIEPIASVFGKHLI
ncbi:MAG: 3-deoxy-7-phosphoheptulonate synthase [Bacteroidetes bacterium]|nr:3-deoxy-7-phosphoheptulonate synthase [Bacteroidia bacterium]PCH68204.1 MAG: 3-deoxy-7-phosphoheptulonate synthase [Bacteroidota bacterium]